MYLYDYHLHTTNSTDGKSSLIDVCKSAITKGIREIAVTDHFEPTEYDKAYTFYQPELFLEQVEEARKIFNGMLIIKYGIELGQPHIYPEYSERIIHEYPFDFVLASGHKIRGDVDFGDIDYTKANLNSYFKKYLDNLKELVEWGQFDCIAHFDLIKRYCARANIKINLMDSYEDKITEILKLIIEKKKGIEINTSGLRQYSAGLMPDRDIISQYRLLGGTNITVGSDAHHAKDVGEGVCETMKLLSKIGFEHMTLYKMRQPYYINLSDGASIKSA